MAHDKWLAYRNAEIQAITQFRIRFEDYFHPQEGKYNEELLKSLLLIVWAFLSRHNFVTKDYSGTCQFDAENALTNQKLAEINAEMLNIKEALDKKLPLNLLKNGRKVVWNTSRKESFTNSKTYIYRGFEGTISGDSIVFDKDTILPFSELEPDDIAFADVITIHKAQGQSYNERVIFFANSNRYDVNNEFSSEPFQLIIEKSLVYTALSRARTESKIIDILGYLYANKNNAYKTTNHTLLCITNPKVPTYMSFQKNIITGNI